MEVLNPRIASSPSIFSRVPIFCSKFPDTTERKKNPSRLSMTNSRFPRRITFSCYSPFSASRNFRILAHFGRPTTRRNHLRKKPTERLQEQVHHSPITHEPPPDFQYPVHKLDDSDSFRLESDNNGATQCSFSPDTGLVNHIFESYSVKESKSKLLWDKLESWVDQYRKDSEFWGIGSGHIFTVFHNSHGKVQRVVVDEGEILRRSQIPPSVYKQSEHESLTEVNSKIAYAKSLAGEIENGNNVLPKNSSVAKFVSSGGQSGFLHVIRGAAFQPGLFPKASRFGIIVLCGFFIIWVVKSLLTTAKDVKEYSRLEKEMMRRKMKARREKENMFKGSVEVIQESKEQEILSTKRPQLDKQAVISNILKAKALSDRLTLPEAGTQATLSMDFDSKIKEIRAMARQVGELERKDHLPNDGDRKADETNDGLSNEKKVIQQHGDEGVSFSNDLSNGYLGQNKCLENIGLASSDDCKSDNVQFVKDIAFLKRGDVQTSALEMEASNDSDGSTRGVNDKECSSNSLRRVKGSQSADIPYGQSCRPMRKSESAKPKVILSIKEAREYLDKKREKQAQNQEHEVRNVQQDDNVLSSPSEMETGDNENQRSYNNDNDLCPSTLSGTLDPKCATDFSEDIALKRIGYNNSEAAEEEHMATDLQNFPVSLVCNEESTPSVSMLSREKEKHSERNQDLCNDNKNFQLSVVVGTSDPTTTLTSCANPILKIGETISAKNCHPGDVGEATGAVDLHEPETSISHESDIENEDIVLPVKKGSWIERNYHEFEPIVRKIGVGFRENYVAARHSSNEEFNIEMIQPKSDEDAFELEWMKDDKLREIVFQVRDNELAGRDPFYHINEEDKVTFFNGLEKKVAEENKKLSKLHEWLHSNIENLDYGADGISLNDPLEKIMPRWKGPPIEKNPEFLSYFVEQRQAVVENARNALCVKNDRGDSSQESKGFPSGDNAPVTLPVYHQNAKIQDEAPKTVIEGSDGSIRAGKKSGKEYWQHTKKWSRGFLESYNAEPDPEIKAAMRDIGKDLDRWITEKEIQEAADLMNKIPERGRKFIEEKVNKVRREMELFGPHAVVSKYREYADEEEDYLWWLDLPFVLCIELYTEEHGEQKIGFYSLEMAADLELEPKPYHVIAFEDAGDCKNLCYIIQAHMEMLGSGRAFVVAQPPKDAFREAKANGFSVTVIRKGELQLNVDQTLEEVEEQIIDIGSKIYHDKIMREQSVDISSIMKGVFRASKPTKRKSSKRKLKKRAKKQ